MEMSGKIRDDKQRVCLSMTSQMWGNIQQAAAERSMTANAFCNFILGEYMTQHQAMMDRFMAMTPEELAEVATALKV